MTAIKLTVGQRLGDIAMVVIVVSVGLAAGAASFTHVKEFTMVNSPAGTGVWFGWANAIITELVPTASALAIRRRRRTNPHAAIGYPVALMSLAVAASLTAQLAVALPTGFGWFVSALPALAFLGLTRLVLHSSDHTVSAPVAVPTRAVATPTPTPIPVPAPSIAVTPPIPNHVPSDSTINTAPTVAQPRPVAAVSTPTPADMPRRQSQRPAPRPASPPSPTDVRPFGPASGRPTISAAALPASTTDTTTVTGSEPGQLTLPGMDLALLAQAYRSNSEHLRQYGSPMTPGQLSVALRISTNEAREVLAALATDTSTDPPANGHTFAATR